MKCTLCNGVIDPDRLDALPNTTTCTGCSKVKKIVTYMDYSHKTAPVVVQVNPNNPEALRLAERAFKRSR